MKPKALPVTSLEDATINFEQLQTRTILDSTPTSFVQLATAKVVKTVMGTATVTWAGASAASGSTAVTFGTTFNNILEVFLSSALSSAGNANFANYLSLTLTGVSVLATSNVVPAAGTTAVVNWVVYGN